MTSSAMCRGEQPSRIRLRRRHEERRAEEAGPVSRSRARRLRASKRRLEEDLAVERRANAAYQAGLAGARISADGTRRMAAGTTKPYQPARNTGGEGQCDR